MEENVQKGGDQAMREGERKKRKKRLETSRNRAFVNREGKSDWIISWSRDKAQELLEFTM